MPPFGLGAAMVASEAQSVFTCKKSCSLVEEAKIFMFSLLARAQIIGFKLLAGNVALIRKFEKTVLPLGLSSLTRAARGSFVFPLARPPTYKYWRRDCFTFHCPCFPASSLFLWRRFFSFGEGSF